MHKQKNLCNGEATGFQCKYYWSQRSKVESNNEDILNKGELQRACILANTVTPMSSDELATKCNMYEARTGFVYDKDDEEYTPLTPEEYKKLQDELPSDFPMLKPPVITYPDFPPTDNEPVSAEDLASLFTDKKEDDNDND